MKSLTPLQLISVPLCFVLWIICGVYANNSQGGFIVACLWWLSLPLFLLIPALINWALEKRHGKNEGNTIPSSEKAKNSEPTNPKIYLRNLLIAAFFSCLLAFVFLILSSL